MCFKCPMFNFSGPVELLSYNVYCFLDSICCECNVCAVVAGLCRM